MRETFLRLDKDKVGWVSKEDLREVLQNYTGMTLSNRCANVISLCPFSARVPSFAAVATGCFGPFLAHAMYSPSTRKDINAPCLRLSFVPAPNRDMVAVENKFCGADGKIRYLDVCRAMSGDGVHPLGGPFCVNIGSSENQDAARGFEKLAVPNKSGTRLMVDLTAK
jgi:hypothetical protein